jgi:hypothetical protein
MMQNGQVFELPMQVHLTTVLESSLLRSPTASQGEGGALGEEEARKRGNTVGIRDQAMDIAKANGEKVSRVVLPTPLTTDRKGSGPNDFPQLRNVRVFFPTPTTIDSRQGNNAASFNRNTPALGAVVHVLPTPVASEGVKASAAQGSEQKSQTGQIWLTNIAHDLAVENDLPVPKGQSLMPTTTASDWKGVNHSGSGSAASRGLATVVEQTNWGKFEPAIRRWEEVLGRPAPAPTKADGKEGAHRLSSAFTEWMMGLPEGWVTDCGLSRNEELKACGNGVVPQQAELALRVLLEGVPLPSGGGK